MPKTEDQFNPINEKKISTDKLAERAEEKEMRK